MNNEDKLNLNAGDYAIRHCVIDQTYNGLEVRKMLCDAYIAGNNDTLNDDKDEKIKNSLINLIKMSNEVGGFALHKWEADEMLAWLEKQGEHVNFLNKIREDAHNTELADKEAARDYKKNCKHFLICKIKRLVHIAVAVIVSEKSHNNDSHKLDRRTQNARDKNSSEGLTAPHKLKAFLHRLRFLGYGNSFLSSDSRKLKENRRDNRRYNSREDKALLRVRGFGAVKRLRNRDNTYYHSCAED